MRRVGIEPLARHDLREVHAGCGDANPDFVFPGRGIGPFAQLQNLGTAVGRYPDRLHGVLE